MLCDLATSIPDWIIDYPETTDVFAELDLDTSCGGKSLEYVCQHRGLHPATVLQRLYEAIARRRHQSNADSETSLPPVPPRLTTRPFPPYSYVPRMHPHPCSDLRGHSRGQSCDRVDPADAVAMWERHCWAVDLFNGGYYWESHEAWESLWIAIGRTGPRGTMFKGLIKLAAAGVKARQGELKGVERHSRRAAELFRTCADSAEVLCHEATGLSSEPLYRESLRLLASAAAILDTTPCAVRRVLPLVLEPMSRPVRPPANG